jgi:hypothetical protein
MVMRMNRIGGLLLAALLVSGGSPWSPALFATETEGLLSVEAIGLLARSHSVEWLGSLEKGISLLQADGPLPSDAFDLVLQAVGAGALAEDPLEAARDLHDAAREADRARRRGVASALLRAEIRLAWQSSQESARGFRLRADPRGEKALQGFSTNNRRAWDPDHKGRSAPEAGSQGSEVGGRR